jgi:hypothetical protein
METLDPRKSFLADQTKVNSFRKFISDKVFVEAMQGALVEFSMESHTQEEMKGANAFLKKFLNFTEIQKEPVRYPDHSQDIWKEPTPPKKKKKA